MSLVGTEWVWFPSTYSHPSLYKWERKTASLSPPGAWNMTCPLGLSSPLYKMIKKSSYLSSKDPVTRHTPSK